MTIDYLKAASAMRVWGGSFVKQLAELYYVADGENRERLAKAFPEYWERYQRIYSEQHNANTEERTDGSDTPKAEG
jgi:hypothetical protein